MEARLSILFVIAAFCLLGSESALSSANQNCVSANTGNFPNEALVGTWYRVYQFTLFGSTIPSASCAVMTFTKPTAAELQAYRDENIKAGHPYEIDDDSVLYDYAAYYQGLISGNTESKFFVLDQKSHMVLGMDGYTVEVYQLVNENYALTWTCSAGVAQPWLITKNRYATEEEMQQVIAGRPELQRMNARRYCENW